MIGDNLKRIREINNIGLNELSRLSGVNASYISAIERGEKSNPSAEILEKLANALKIPIQQFFIDNKSFSNELLSAIQISYGDKYVPMNNERFLTFISKELDIDEEQLYRVYNDKSFELPMALSEKLLTYLYNLDTLKYFNFKNDIIESSPSQIGNYLFERIESISNPISVFKEDASSYSVNNTKFSNPQDALQFILKQPAFMSYGGYDFYKMSDDEILEVANDMLFAMKLSVEKIKRKSK